MNINDLIPKLLETTIRRKIEWFDVGNDTFISIVGKQKFQIVQGTDQDNGEMYYRLDIISGGGKEPFEGKFIDMTYADRFQGAFSDLSELYANARRNALRLDEVISDIDDELNKLLS